MSTDYYPAPDELRDAWINDANHGMPPESMECPNCGRPLDDCNGNCIFGPDSWKPLGESMESQPADGEALPVSTLAEPEGLIDWIDEVEARWWDNPQNTAFSLPPEEVFDEH